jgi:hypothetical protein
MLPRTCETEMPDTGDRVKGKGDAPTVGAPFTVLRHRHACHIGPCPDSPASLFRSEYQDLCSGSRIVDSDRNKSCYAGSRSVRLGRR